MNKTLSVTFTQWGILALAIASLILFFYNISDDQQEKPDSSPTALTGKEYIDKTRMGSRLSFPMPDRPRNTLSSAQSRREPLIPSLPLDKVALEKKTHVSRNVSKATLSKKGRRTFEKDTRPISPAEKSTTAKKALNRNASKAMPLISKQPSKPSSHIEELVYPDEKAFLRLRVSSYPYSISLGSFKTLVKAQKAISIFQEKGMVPYWVKVDLGTKGLWFRVFSGYFRTREEADTFIKNNKIVDGKSRHTKYANLIGTYSSGVELEEMRLRLLKIEYYPYVIGGTEAVSFLFAGAFYQRRRAEKQRAELASKGIASEVVER